MNQIIKVIIADDQRIIRDGYISILRENETFSIEGEASNGKEVIEMLVKKKADVLILDIEMPVMDGFDALPIIKERFPKIKVLVVSFHNEKMYMAACIKKGADGYLTKDSSGEELIDAIFKLKRNGFLFDEAISDILVSDLIDDKNRKTNTECIPLTRTEEEVLQFIYYSKTNQEIKELMKAFPKIIDLVICEKKVLKEIEEKVLIQMALGKKEKEISKILNISVHTVDKYKRKLRTKTGLKTRATLALYAVKHGYVSI